MFKKLSTRLYLILLVTVLAGLFAYPKEHVLLQAVGIDAQPQILRGLDLQGGVRLVFEADFSEDPDIDKDEAFSGLINVIQDRVDQIAGGEAVVQRGSDNRVITEIPGADNPAEVIERVGRPAELTFIAFEGSNPQTQGDEQQTPNIVPADIDGSDVARADPSIDPSTGQPVVSMRFKSGESTERFAQLTTQLHSTGGQLAILLDDRVVFGPATVQTPITNGTVQLSGNFQSVAEAEAIAEDINSGALPVPVELVEQRTVGPTLGEESIRASMLAGAIGLGLIFVFLLLNYRLFGLLAIFTIIFYGMVTASIYKISGYLEGYSIVLTLAGIAGFILSVAVAADGSVLIFERIKEEIRNNTRIKTSINSRINTSIIKDGFDNAWSSIRDANVATFIASVILYYFGASVIRGFAMTLGLGVLLNLALAWYVTQVLLVAGSKTLPVKAWWIGSFKKKSKKLKDKNE